jgi:hypothetical protein
MVTYHLASENEITVSSPKLVSLIEALSYPANQPDSDVDISPLSSTAAGGSTQSRLQP